MKKMIYVHLILLISFSLFASNSQILHQTEDLIEIAFKIDEFKIVKSGDFDKIEIENSISRNIEGAPDIPYFVLYLGIPFESNPNLLIFDNKLKTERDINLIPCASFMKMDGLVGEKFEMDLSKYENLGKQPLVKIRNLNKYRYQNVLELEINPIYYNYFSRKLEINEFKIQIRFNRNRRKNILNYREMKNDDFYNHLLNKAEARKWRGEVSVKNRQIDDPFTKAAVWYKFYVKEKGVCKLSKSYLATKGVDASSLDNIRVFSGGGKPLPFELNFIELKEIAIKQNDDEVLFYAYGTKGPNRNNTLDLEYYDNINPYTK